MSRQLDAAQARADVLMREHWKVVDGVLEFDGQGQSLCTAKDYGDFEMYVDWKIMAKGDSGIYLRGSPQVQIWDSAENPVGSGGLYNNKKNPSEPSHCADKPVGEWNRFYIKMVGDRVTVKLNGELVVDNVVLENYWERDKPIYQTGQIELQNHGNTLYFKKYLLERTASLTSLAPSGKGGRARETGSNLGRVPWPAARLCRWFRYPHARFSFDVRSVPHR